MPAIEVFDTQEDEVEAVAEWIAKRLAGAPSPTKLLSWCARQTSWLERRKLPSSPAANTVWSTSCRRPSAAWFRS
ncbi:MAG: hypothetical protein OXG37_16700 [Actinomycetia bacterium]|nr:hypothetical protein [Actinomycetes bacterium]